MSGWYLMDDNPYLGVRRWGLDDENGTVIRTEYYMAVPFMEANQRSRIDSAGQRFGDFRHVASIPMHIWARQIAPLEKEGDRDAVKKWLNNPDNRAFRTFDGKV